MSGQSQNTEKHGTKTRPFAGIPMIGAVMGRDVDEVRRLADQGIGINERDPGNQCTPVIYAAFTDQWPVVEILMDHGADIWAHNEFGATAAQAAISSRVLRDTPDGQALLRVIDKLKARGYPFPPPDPDKVLELEKAGKWPPAGVKR